MSRRRDGQVDRPAGSPPTVDIGTPSPDDAHEAIRLAVLQVAADVNRLTGRITALTARVTALETQTPEPL